MKKIFQKVFIAKALLFAFFVCGNIFQVEAGIMPNTKKSADFFISVRNRPENLFQKSWIQKTSGWQSSPIKKGVYSLNPIPRKKFVKNLYTSPSTYFGTKFERLLEAASVRRLKKTSKTFTFVKEHASNRVPHRKSSVISAPIVITPPSTGGNSTSLYMWSQAFQNNSTLDVTNFVNSQNVTNAIVYLGSSKTYRTEKVAAISSFVASGKTVEAMIDHQDFISETAAEITTYLNDVFSGFNMSSITTVHLDIEPHTLPDWHTNKTTYLDQYLSMLDTVRAFCNTNNVQLAVSIPLHYPENYTQQIIDKVDTVYFMAYENINPTYIERQVAPFLENDSSKIVISLLTEDFSSVENLKNFATSLLSQLNLTRYSIHDFSSLKNLSGE